MSNLTDSPTGGSRARSLTGLKLDNLERNFSLGGGIVVILAALLYIPRLSHDTFVTTTAKPGVANSCKTGYILVKSLCSKTVVFHPSYYLVGFLLILIFGIGLCAFGYFRNRPAVMVTSLLAGFVTGAAGILFFFVAGWFGVRAYRMNKYGTSDMREAGIRARQMRKDSPRSPRTPRAARTRGRGKEETDSPLAKPVEASKRYTPKKTKRR